MSDQWREMRLTYLVPEGEDFEELETEMIEACARLLGCKCEQGEVGDGCAAQWVGSSIPLE